MRKSFLTFVLTLLTGVLFAQQPTRVNVAQGTLEGLNESGIKTFKGIPFAAPPVGDLRWKAPQPVEKWQGVRQAKEFGPNPMQENIFGDMNFGTKKMSEDCLYLNIWTPAKKMNEHLPVLIYFNGGGLGERDSFGRDRGSRRGGRDRGRERDRGFGRDRDFGGRRERDRDRGFRGGSHARAGVHTATQRSGSSSFFKRSDAQEY